LEQSDALREHGTEELDWENLAAELGDLARNERHAFRSQCAGLVEHLLKFAFAAPAEVERNRSALTKPCLKSHCGASSRQSRKISFRQQRR